MVSLQSALLPEAKRPPCLSLVDATVVASTATSKKRKRDDESGSDEDGIELNFDAAPLPLEWQRCLDIKSGQIHYYNTRTRKRTSKDPRAEPEPEPYCAAAPAAEEPANWAPPGLDLELHLTFEPRRVLVQEKKAKPPAEAKPAEPEEAPAGEPREMVAGVCMRCHMLVMMCRACPACPNCKFLHPPSRGVAVAPPAPPEPEPEPAPLRLGLQLLCCKD